jgi:hypothetical protein
MPMSIWGASASWRNVNSVCNGRLFSLKVMADAWSRAAELAVKFLDGERAVDVAERAGPRLVELGGWNFVSLFYLRTLTLFTQ